jgi:WD40 repeat protein
LNSVRHRWWAATPFLSRHLGPITTIDAHPRDGTLVTGGYDGHVLRWSQERGRVEWCVRFADLVNSARFDPSGDKIAVAVADGYVYVVDSRTGFTMLRLGPHGDDANDASWSYHEDGLLAVVCDAGDTSVHLWRTDGAEAIHAALPGHHHGVFAVAFSPANPVFATASEDMSVRLWDAAASEPIAVLKHPGDVETLAWSPDGRVLATGCDDGTLRLWDPHSGEVRSSIVATASLRRVAFAPTGDLVLCGSYDGYVRLVSPDTFEVAAELRTPQQWERSGVFVDAATIAVGSFGGSPHLICRAYANWSSAAAEAPTPTDGLTAVAPARDGFILGADCVVARWGSKPDIVVVRDTLITAVREDSDDVVAIGDYLGNVTVVGPDRRIVVVNTRGGPVNSLAWLPDGILISGGYDGVIRTFTRAGDAIDTVRAHDGPIKSVAWNRAAAVIAAGSSDNTLSAWCVDGGKLGEVLRYSADDLVLVNSVASSVQHPWVAVASRDRTPRIWHLMTGEVRRLPRIHSKSVKAIAVDAEGRTIATGSYDGTICIWRFDDGVLVGWKQLLAHGKPGVASVAFLADGSICSVGWNGSVMRCTADGQMLALAWFTATAPLEGNGEGAWI